MYSKEMLESIAKVEANRAENTAMEPRRMTAEEKEVLLATYHPDYKQSEFSVLEIGPNKGDKVPTELAELLQAGSRIKIGQTNRNEQAAVGGKTLQNRLCAVNSVGCTSCGLIFHMNPSLYQMHKFGAKTRKNLFFDTIAISVGI